MAKWEEHKVQHPTSKFKGDKRSGCGGNRKVTAAKTSSYNSKEFLGIFWPEKIWKSLHKDKKIAKRDVVWIEHQGKRSKDEIMSFLESERFAVCLWTEFVIFSKQIEEFNRGVFPLCIWDLRI